MAAPLLELRGVHAGYGRIEVLHGVDLSVAAGSVVALLGPNGAGKSTLLRVAALAHPLTRGDVVVGGRVVTGAPADDLARAGVCLVPEGRGVFPNLTVRENLRMATYAGTRLAAVEEVAYARFPRLAERRSQPAGSLSGGEQQQLALARALAVDPAVLLLDELSLGLAPLVVDELYRTVADVAGRGVAVVAVEQLAHLVLEVADHVVVLAGGRVVRAGPPGDIGGELAAAYLGDA
ncbi:MAG: ATP-binding cassette domain-containing protein [Acidimicrobiales bacterium]|nr:ATP-binding cassette domain-containing protein [Acidimicrobiales bacterium]